MIIHFIILFYLFISLVPERKKSWPGLAWLTGYLVKIYCSGFSLGDVTEMIAF